MACAPPFIRAGLPAARAISRRRHVAFLHPRQRGRRGIPARTITRRGCRKESCRAHRVSLSAMSIRSRRYAPLLAMLVAAGCGSSGSASDAGDAAIEVPEPVRRRRCVPDRSAVRQRAELRRDGLHAGRRRRQLPGRNERDAELPGRWTAGLPRRLFGVVRVRGAARRLRDAQLRVRDRALFARDVSRDDGRPRRLRRAVARARRRLAPPPSSAGTPAAKMPCPFSALRFSLIAHPSRMRRVPGRLVTASPTGEPFHPPQGSIVCGTTRPGSTPGGFRSGRPRDDPGLLAEFERLVARWSIAAPIDGPLPVAQGGRRATRAEGLLRDRASLARRPVARFTGFHTPAEQAGARRWQTHLHHREPGELPARTGVAPRRLDSVGLHVRAVGPDGRNSACRTCW